MSDDSIAFQDTHWALEDLATYPGAPEGQSKARECFGKSLEIKSILYGNDSKEAKEINNQIEEIK